MRDQIFQQRRDTAKPFVFDDAVAEVFDDMAARSIPYYRDLQNLTVQIARRFYRRGTAILDLGCATGNTLAALMIALPGVERFCAYDSSPPMIERARRRLLPAPHGTVIDIECRKIEDAPLSEASVVIAHYTLQFVDPMLRHDILSRIHHALVPGGSLIFSEKVVEDDDELSKCFIDNYHAFKRGMGYSDREIEQKARALEGVLVPLSVAQNLALLKNAGFTRVAILFKWQNFASFIALRGEPLPVAQSS